MNEPKGSDSRPYHHGDLRRALLEAARRLLEAEGPSALSLRAVAREAGVSPAAPYHHFKDKAELLDAVAEEGWDLLHLMMQEVRESEKDYDARLIALGLAYVCFARDNPALYRVMYDAARDKDSLPTEARDRPYGLVRSTMTATGAGAREVEYATIAAWCCVHGLAEMSGFKHFEQLKEELGSERLFFQAVLKHMGPFTRNRET
jgi:AcrR family transcriptional regulator